MAEPLTLRGMTWDHPRGHAPLVAASEQWLARKNVRIVWDRRSLQDFEAYPVRALAEEYDLIIIDHPHVGAIAEEGCLVPLDAAGRESDYRAIAAGTVGRSFDSYHWAGRQWAFPVDAATQVQAWRPDRISAPLSRWRDVAALAKEGRIAVPLRPPHALMTLFTLCGLGGISLSTSGPALFPVEQSVRAYELLREIVAAVDPRFFAMDPIAVLDEMSQDDDSYVALAPFIYGYVNYALPGFRAHPIRFGDLPALGAAGPAGSALGGTGIAVSALKPHIEEATAFAFWVAGGAFQRTTYCAAGGQAGHAAAWDDDAVNQATDNFYRNTRHTLDSAWVRPRHPGYMSFQESASDRLDIALRRGEDGRSVIPDLNRLFEQSL